MGSAAHASTRRHRRRQVLLGGGLVLSVVLAAGLYWFQPWKLFVDHRVDERLPAVALDPVPVADVSGAARTPVTDVSGAARTPAADASTPPARRQAVLLSRGSLISHEHPTSGIVSVVRQPDGSRVLAIADLDTSDGPDVHVWLTDQRVTADGWHVFDDGKHVDLGSLKGNLGNQVYEIPDDANLRRLTSVSIWCERFDVSFGATQLARA